MLQTEAQQAQQAAKKKKEPREVAAIMEDFEEGESRGEVANAVWFIVYHLL